MLSIETLEDISALRESVDIECKLAQGRDGQGALPKDIWETVCAFANTQGGDIFLGLKEMDGGCFQLAGVPKIKQGWTDLGHALNICDAHMPYLQTITELYWHDTDFLNGQESGQESDQETTVQTSVLQDTILVYLQRNPSATRVEIANTLKTVSESQVKYQLRRLQELGLLERIGSTKAGEWKVKK